MITYFQSMFLGLLQGLTELFPVSSLGHSVILPGLLGWNFNQHDNYFLIFLVATHLATSLVLFGFFFGDWILICKGIFRSLRNRKISAEAGSYEKLGWLLIVATIPAGILGILFEEKLKEMFASPRSAAVFLFLNGLVLFAAEYMRASSAKSSARAISEKNESGLSWTQSIQIGFAQALALLPGFSRTGTTLGAGLLVGLTHEQAARFSFLLATPIIFAAAVLKLPELLTSTGYPIGPLAVGFIASGAAAYVSIKFLTSYFKTKTLKPFAWYCCAAGALAFLILLFR